MAGLGTERHRATASREHVRTQLVEVAAALLTEHGPDGVTTRAVSTAAGVQPPTMYRLFGDKDGLLDAVAEHVLATYAGDKALDEAADPLEDFHTGWRRHIGFGLAHPHVFTLMAVPRSGAHSRAATMGREVLLARIRRIAAAGQLRVGERQAADLTQAVGTGTVLTLIALPEAQRDLALADTAYRGLLAAITTATPVLPQPGPVAAAAALRASATALTSLTSAERELLTEWLDRITDAPTTASS